MYMVVSQSIYISDKHCAAGTYREMITAELQLITIALHRELHLFVHFLNRSLEQSNFEIP